MSGSHKNFYEARKLRRDIVKQSQNQQAADSGVARQIKDRLLAGERQILDSLCRLLDSFSGNCMPSVADRALFGRIVSWSFIDEWNDLRRLRTGLLPRIALNSSNKAKADNRYGEDSPLGPVSRWFKDESSTRISEALKADCARLSLESAFLSAEKQKVDSEIQSKAQEFLRAAMRTDALTYLANAPSPIRAELAKVLGEVSEAVDRIWEKHGTDQKASFAAIGTSASSLSEQYAQGR